MGVGQYQFKINEPASYSINNVTTGTGAAIAFNNCWYVNWYVRAVTPGALTGNVIIECSNDPAYTGTWVALATIDLATIGTPLTTPQWRYGCEAPPGGIVRARITTEASTPIIVQLNGLLS